MSTKPMYRWTVKPLHRIKIGNGKEMQDVLRNHCTTEPSYRRSDSQIKINNYTLR